MEMSAVDALRHAKLKLDMARKWAHAGFIRVQLQVAFASLSQWDILPRGETTDALVHPVSSMFLLLKFTTETCRLEKKPDRQAERQTAEAAASLAVVTLLHFKRAPMQPPRVEEGGVLLFFLSFRVVSSSVSLSIFVVRGRCVQSRGAPSCGVAAVFVGVGIRCKC